MICCSPLCHCIHNDLLLWSNITFQQQQLWHICYVYQWHRCNQAYYDEEGLWATHTIMRRLRAALPTRCLYLSPFNCCGLRPQRTMAAKGRKEGLCDLSNVVAFGHNEQWRPKAVKVATKLDKIPPSVYYKQSSLHPLCCARACGV